MAVKQRTRIGTWEWSHEEMRLRRGRSELRLTDRERKLLAYLAERLDQTVTTEELLQEVWGYAPTVHSRAIDHAVSRLRKKLGRDAVQLQTVYGRGYALARTVDEDLLGRSDDVSEVASALSTHRQLTLYGLAGVGKTRVAQAVTELAERSIWVDARSLRTPEDVVARVAEALDLGPAADAARVGDVARQRVDLMIVIDGAETLGAWLVPLTHPWTADEGARVLLTSRFVLGQEPAYELAPLDEDAAWELLQQRVQAHLPHPPPPEGLARQLVNLVGRLPLAIELVAARLRMLEVEELLSRLRRSTELLDGAEGRLQQALQSTWNTLDAAQQRTLAAASMFPGSFRFGDLEGVLKQSPGALLDALEGLRRAALWVREGPEFRLLDLVRSFAHDHAGADVRDAFVQWAVDQARWASRVHLKQEAESFADGPRMPDIYVTALELTEDANARAYLAVAMHFHDLGQGPLLRALPILEALPIEALEPDIAFKVLRQRSVSYADGNDRPRGLAWAKKALDRAQADGEMAHIVDAWQWYVMIHRMVRGAEATLPTAKAFLQFAQTQAASDITRAMALTEYAHCLTPLGRFDEAYRLYLQALSLAESHPRLSARLHTRLGFVCHMQSRMKEAVHQMRVAVELAETYGSPRLVSVTKHQLAEALSVAGDAEGARQAFEDALRIAELLRDPRGLFTSRLGLAELEPDAGKARAAFEQLREQAYVAGRERDAAMASYHLGRLHHLNGSWDAADAAYTEGLKVIAPIGWLYFEAMIRTCYAMLLAERGQQDAATEMINAVTPGSAQAQTCQALGQAAIVGDWERVDALLQAESGGTIETVAALARRLRPSAPR